MTRYSHSDTRATQIFRLDSTCHVVAVIYYSYHIRHTCGVVATGSGNSSRNRCITCCSSQMNFTCRCVHCRHSGIATAVRDCAEAVLILTGRIYKSVITGVLRYTGSRNIFITIIPCQRRSNRTATSGSAIDIETIEITIAASYKYIISCCQ